MSKAYVFTPAEERKIIELRDVHGLTFISIGKRYSIDGGTASKVYTAAKEKLAVAK